MPDTIEERFRDALPAVEFCSLRFVNERDEIITVRQDVPQPVHRYEDTGAMVTVIDRGGMGYAATSDLSPSGLRAAIGRAVDWARATAGRCAVDVDKLTPADPTGEYVGPEQTPWDDVPLADKFDLLKAECARLKTDERIVDFSASLWWTAAETLLVTGGGGRVFQQFRYIAPSLQATASAGAEAQTRTFGGRACCRQGGMEVLGEIGYRDAAPTVAAEAVQMLEADDCPTGTMDVLLSPDQLILQIHESIGHPLELDRILGDERNYAGTSFVTADMFGSYRYGSDLLNVCYDPTRPEQLATFGCDDEGTTAAKAYVIKDGILQRPLGGAVSQARAGLPGVANSRACSWNRPPIDRMANLNLDPGDSALEEMIAAVKRGVWMKTNRSWSIDDSRNKFQFGCEWARLIEDGQLTRRVKNPNYRGVSATFWRNLKMVGDPSTFEVLGTPNCGKGEPNQMIRVGHACPASLFADVEVFGGA